MLERRHVDRLANLAEAGADCLRAVEIVTRIELEHGVDLVDTYFAAPMIARLAEEVRRTQDRSGDWAIRSSGRPACAASPALAPAAVA
jgi:hypothetical protein